MSELSRRTFLARAARAAAAAAAAPLIGCTASAEGAVDPGATDPGSVRPPGAVPRGAAAPTEPARTAEQPAPLEVAMLVYPGMTALDMVAPQMCFATLGDARVHHVWKDLSPIESDSGIVLLPNLTLDECPAELDILFVGGASRATWPLMNDLAILEFLASRGATARFVTSVCTGSMLLAAAGLLIGHRATGNWASRHLLAQLGATCVNERVVVDCNRITGAGVTAGFDFGLRVSELVRGRQHAEVTQLMAEYSPEPPFISGTPEEASPEVLGIATALYAPSVAAGVEATRIAAQRLGL